MSLYRMSQENLDRIAAHPPYSIRAIMPHTPELWCDQPVVKAKKAGWPGRIFGRSAEPIPAVAPQPPPPDFTGDDLATLQHSEENEVIVLSAMWCRIKKVAACNLRTSVVGATCHRRALFFHSKAESYAPTFRKMSIQHICQGM